jgi:hypothetical protein
MLAQMTCSSDGRSGVYVQILGGSPTRNGKSCRLRRGPARYKWLACPSLTNGHPTCD